LFGSISEELTADPSLSREGKNGLWDLCNPGLKPRATKISSLRDLGKKSQSRIAPTVNFPTLHAINISTPVSAKYKILQSLY
jgi:hypothetical protein